MTHRIHWLQHVPFEGLGLLGEIVREKTARDKDVLENVAPKQKWEITHSPLFQTPSFPSVESFDGLIVMGGPMGVYDQEKHPWLTDEKKFVEASLKAGKKVLGVCLGAQILADVLGARVVNNGEREVGWFPVKRVKASQGPLAVLPEVLTPLHWHGDMFEIPEGTHNLYQSPACPNQAFEWNGGQAVALQFHLEVNRPGVESLMEHCAADLKPGEWVQSRQTLLRGCEGEALQKEWCETLLSEWLSGDAGRLAFPRGVEPRFQD